MDLEKNRKKWKKLLADHQDSGKTIKQFCLEHDVKVHQFQYYKKRFKKETVQNETETSNFVIFLLIIIFITFFECFLLLISLNIVSTQKYLDSVKYFV